MTNVADLLSELRSELQALREQVSSLNARTAALEAKLDEIEKRLDSLERMITQRNGYMKWMIVMLGMILSFVAALFGLGWRPNP